MLQPSVKFPSRSTGRLKKKVSFSSTAGSSPRSQSPVERRQRDDSQLTQIPVRQVLSRATSAASAAAASSLARVQDILSASPALRIFVYTSATLSVIPLGLFGMYVGMTLVGTVLSAVIGALLVESGLVLVGLSVLVPIEGAILGIAGAAALTYASSGFGLGLLEGASLKVFGWTGLPVHRLLLPSTTVRSQGAISDGQPTMGGHSRRAGPSLLSSHRRHQSAQGWREETREVLRVHQILETAESPWRERGDTTDKEQGSDDTRSHKISPPKLSKKLRRRR